MINKKNIINIYLVFCDDNKIREAQVLKKKPLSSLQCLHFN